MAVSVTGLRAVNGLGGPVIPGRQLQSPVDIMIHLFDTLVIPILLHGSEFWAHERT